jgi:hypothetical protein
LGEIEEKAVVRRENKKRVNPPVGYKIEGWVVVGWEQFFEMGE